MPKGDCPVTVCEQPVEAPQNAPKTDSDRVRPFRSLSHFSHTSKARAHTESGATDQTRPRPLRPLRKPPTEASPSEADAGARSGHRPPARTRVTPVRKQLVEVVRHLGKVVGVSEDGVEIASSRSPGHDGTSAPPVNERRAAQLLELRDVVSVGAYLAETTRFTPRLLDRFGRVLVMRTDEDAVSVCCHSAGPTAVGVERSADLADLGTEDADAPKGSGREFFQEALAAPTLVGHAFLHRPRRSHRARRAGCGGVSGPGPSSAQDGQAACYFAGGRTLRRAVDVRHAAVAEIERHRGARFRETQRAPASAGVQSLSSGGSAHSVRQ